MNRRQFLAVPIAAFPMLAATELVAAASQLKEAVRKSKTGRHHYFFGADTGLKDVAAAKEEPSIAEPKI